MTKQWTPEAIRALGATTDLPTLGSIFGLGRWRSYQMAHTGEWEQAGIRIIHVGSRYRVSVQSILDVLSQGRPPSADADGEQSGPGPVSPGPHTEPPGSPQAGPPGAGSEQPAPPRRHRTAVGPAAADIRVNPGPGRAAAHDLTPGIRPSHRNPSRKGNS